MCGSIFRPTMPAPPPPPPPAPILAPPVTEVKQGYWG